VGSRRLRCCIACWVLSVTDLGQQRIYVRDLEELLVDGLESIDSLLKLGILGGELCLLLPVSTCPP
jgi:hypothetical protein